MKQTDAQLDHMIQQSQYGKPENQDEYWFSYQNQKLLAYDLAKELVLQGEDHLDAITSSKQFVDTFYKHAIRAGSWER